MRRDIFATLSGLLLLAGGMTIMAGWLGRWPVWDSVLPSTTATVFNTALCLALAGIALVARTLGTRHARYISKALGCFVAGIAVLVLVENIFSVNLGIDWHEQHRWFRDRNPVPGRMAPNTAFALLLGGIALALDYARDKARMLRYVIPAAMLTTGILGIIASTLPLDLAYGWFMFPHMALPTGGGIILFSTALLSEAGHDGSAGARSPSDTRIYAFMGVALTLLLSSAVVSYGSIRALIAGDEWVRHSQRVRMSFEVMLALNERAHIVWRDYLLDGDPEDKQRYRTLVDAMYARHVSLMQLTRAKPVQRSRLAVIGDSFDREFAELDKGVRQVEQKEITGSEKLIARLPWARAERARLDAAAAGFRDLESTLLTQRQRESQSSSLATLQSIIAGNVLGLVILLYAFWLLIRQNAERNRMEGEIRALNASLLKHAAQLETANKELESFAYSVSHDLRAPLRAIDGYAQMLEEDCQAALDAEGRRYLAQVRTQSKRMGELIDDLLRFSRLGRQSLNRVELDMGDLVRRVFDEELAHHPGQAPRVELAGLPPALADPALLRQVWSNLISNALKYSAKVQAPEIRIGGERIGDELVYSIRDNGAGFDMAYYDKLFGVFQRLHSMEEFSGTGVGLAIIQRVIARHGGRVWAEGRINAGATFHFTLPAGAGDG